MSFAINPYTPPAGAAIGSSPPAAPDGSAASRNSGASSAVDDFMKLANETPAQRMRDAILKSMGLSEDDLKSMSPDKRKAVEETIRRRIQEAAEQAAKNGKTGLVADLKA